MKDIVIIQSTPLTKHTYKIFHIDELLCAGFNVEYWDMSQYFFPGITLMDEIKENYCKYINSIAILKNKLQNIIVRNTLFIVEVFDCWKNRKFFKLLKKIGCFTVRFQLFATADIPIGIFNRFIQENSKGKFRMFKSFFTSKLYNLYRKIYHFSSFDVEISSNPSLNCSQTVFINHPDYEQSKEDYYKNNLFNFKYAVFLDEYFPLHPDLIYCNKFQINNEDSKNYLKIMCNFFEIIEQQFNIQIVIAAHPKSKYTETDYGNRCIMKYVTGQLIKYAQFAILHSSAAVAFAAIWHCPLLFCSTNKYKKLLIRNHEYIYKLSQYFNAPLINIEHLTNSELPNPYINNNACEDYKYTYLTRPEIEKLKNKDIIINYLKKL
jgi:hypothetical protein